MKKLFYVIITIFFTCIDTNIFACTAFCLKSNGNIYLAKNLDWPIDCGYLFLNERGIDKNLISGSIINLNEFHWVSKYRSLTFNQLGKEFPLGGMNEKGLVIEELNMQASPVVTDPLKTPINEFQFVQYILDNFESIGEIKEHLDQFQYIPLFQHLHYIVADKSGNILIIENNGSDFSLFYPNRTGLRVLSNNNYKESVNYCSNFKGFGGNLPVVNRKGSNERFVFTARLIADFDNNNPVEYSYMILDSVKQYDTRWSIVYDINNLCVHVKFHSCTNIKVFDLRKILDLKNISSLGGDLSDCTFINNNGLTEISADENTGLIKKGLSLLFADEQRPLDYNLLYNMAVNGNHELACKTPQNIVRELDQHITGLPELSPLEYPDTVFDKVLNWGKYKAIAIGEATHGTKEFCELKHRLFRYLVENYNFKVLAYEFSFRKSLDINNYILYGSGNIDSLLAKESWIQNNTEVKNLIRWMMLYNQDKSPEDKIHFIGIDNQLDALSPEETIGYLTKKYPHLIDIKSDEITQIRQLQKIPYSSMSGEEYIFRKELFQKMKTRVLKNLNIDEDTLSDYTSFNVYQLIQSLINSHEFLYMLCKAEENLRDKQLAENALNIINGPNKDHGMVVWAHNAHIACNPDYYEQGNPAMGKYLKDALGSDYLSVATSFSKGRFKAVMLDSDGNDTDPLTCRIDTEPPCSSVNNILNKARSYNYLLKINDIEPGAELFSYLNTKKPFIGIGDLYLGAPEKHFFYDRIINIVDSYDLLFYFGDTSPVDICSNEKIIF